MKGSRRISRMTRAKLRKSPGLNLVPLVDVFTILVFFLLFNSASSDVMEPPKTIDLPASYVESKPRETVSVMVTEKEILVQGESVISTSDVMATTDPEIAVVIQRLLEQKSRIIGISEKTISDSSEVIVLADKTLPFELLKKVLSSCTRAGYERISLAVLQKAPQSQ